MTAADRYGKIAADVAAAAEPRTPGGAKVVESIRSRFLSEVESYPAPAGYRWTVTTFAGYDKACREKRPTLHLEVSDGEQAVAMVYLVGQDLLGRVVAS